jgi:branched-chain amino acid transport system permease protein
MRDIVICAVLLAVPLVLPEWMKFIVTLALAKFLAVLAVALFLRAGMVTFGHAMFYAVGAYTVGFGAKWFGFRDVAILLPLGAILGAAVAALVGLVMARYREIFFAMLNLAFSMMLYGALLKLYRVTGGTDGLSAGARVSAITPRWNTKTRRCNHRQRAVNWMEAVCGSGKSMTRITRWPRARNAVTHLSRHG